MAQYTDVPDALEAHLRSRDAGLGGARSPACRGRASTLSPGSTAARKRSFIRIGYGFSRSRNGAASLHAVSLPAGGDRRLAASRRRRALRNGAPLSARRTLIKGWTSLDPLGARSTCRASGRC
jgi:hypothetical protein